MIARPSCPSTRYAAFGGSIRKLSSLQSLSREMLQGCRNTATNSVRDKKPRICASCTASAIPAVDHISEVRNNCLRIHSFESPDRAPVRFQLETQYTRWQGFPSNSCFLFINFAQSTLAHFIKLKESALVTMRDSRGPILIVNTLIFGIIAFCSVVSRLGFCLYTKKTSASDWFLAARESAC